MLFNSLAFILFFPCVLLLYAFLPKHKRWLVLLLASYVFYMWWEPVYAFLIMGSTLVDYFLAFQLDKSSNSALRRLYVAASVVVNLGLLGLFKYYNFFAQELVSAFASAGFTMNLDLLELLLPVGISFYTFQTLSYTIDVYRKHIPAEKHLGIFATYVAFFPQLVAGPIERFGHLGPQIRNCPDITYTNFARGFRLILFGLFTKMCVADHLAVPVDAVYADPTSYNQSSILAGIFGYSFQIYADFFGYSLIAVGAAKVMGIDIIDNFKAPYLSNSLYEFWKRWHISLTAWFRSYLYFPLGGNRGNTFKWFRNILIVFILSGLWHGANWTFILWGLLHGFIYLIEISVSRFMGLEINKMPRALKFLNALKTFVLVTLLWVFFRAKDVDHAMDVFASLLQGTGEKTLFEANYLPWIMLGLFFLFEPVFYANRLDTWLGTKTFAFRWSVYSILLAALLFFAAIVQQPFIYFQF